MKPGYSINKNAAGKFDYGILKSNYIPLSGNLWFDGWQVGCYGQPSYVYYGEADTFADAQTAIDSIIESW